MLSSLKPITIGIAISGGGYRSFLNGAGALAAFDDRTMNSTNPGHLGGVLQSTSYISAISGGSWLLMSMILGDYEPIVKLKKEWHMLDPLLEGIPNMKQVEVSRNDVQVLPVDFKDDDGGFYEKLRFKTFFKDMFKKKEEPKISATNVLPNIEVSPDLSLKNIKKIFNFYKNLHVEVRSKKSVGFPVSFTDYWGRALSRKIFPKSARSPNKTFSSVTMLNSFQMFYQPLPIILSNLREPGVEKTSINSNIFEFTPFEFGSWDLKMFMNLKYLGSLLCGGVPVFHISKKAICFNNFDNAGFITGTSSSLFNNVLIYVWQLAATSTREKYRAIKAVLNTFGLTSQQNGIDPKKHPDYALYTPNPFYRYGQEQNNEIFHDKHLYMVDGGEDGQNIPIQPLLQKSRQVDLIFALDSTADVGGWPNGTILQNTMDRYHHKDHKGTTVSIDGVPTSIDLFPEIPKPKMFVDKKLNKRPIFFGCHLSKFPKRNLNKEDVVDEYLPPIVGYFANTNHSYLSNTSTFRLTYTDDEVSHLIENAYNIMSYSNSTIDENYYKCIGCIMVKREFDRRSRGLSLINQGGKEQASRVPGFCGRCYKDYCYN
ncbi:hypothetical protein WICANDRAFT_31907 [Wickerhamomyces anomalus NRRL Y-366-8]|uniref:Lysophospholipase n=1 Tax=Wickerhamomyces anomalus (strain ATCC 58044 / CBS 1984 / NCYC 433 / NRRL Y-366-8) TaxID=683960 RepID=A0A1E3P162_WICAA|nr:uncharacterized protein WICANDRAFT_31907 [Wickerhamomyces anomalus NRRL Y-366-8]ODQ58657.1 hypothetical protein WICANDRAFT_31907 [Wickerhamomyces anomalus NRRL Y-366-8]